jgi:U4/U6.U5 tri-snRNP-associated protein 1
MVKKEALKVDAAPLTMMKRELPDDNTPMIEAEELEAGEVVLKEEDEDDDSMLNAIENIILVTEAKEKAVAVSEDLNIGTSSEQTFSTGMASTLNILWQQGLLVSTSHAPPTAPQPQMLKVTDYLIGHQLDGVLAAGQDLVISWPFANG